MNVMEWVEIERAKLNYMLSVKDQILCVTPDEWEDIDEMSKLLISYPDKGAWEDLDEKEVANMIRTIHERIRFIKAILRHRQSLMPEGIQ